MVMKWLEGFETHTSATQLARKYGTLTGNIAVNAGRVFGNAGGPQTLVAVTPSLGLSTTYIIGFGVRISAQQTVLNSGAQGIYLEKASTEQCHIEFVNNVGSFEIRILRGGTTIATTAQAFAYAVWHHFEISLTIDPTTGAYEVRHDEVNILSGTGVNLAGAGTAQADIFAMRFSSNVSSTVSLDDMNVKDTTGSKNNNFLGDFVIEGLLPNAAGTTTQWTNDAGSGANFNNVQDLASTTDEAGAGGTNSSDTSGQKDTYNFADLTQIDGSITAVQVGVQLAMAAAGSRNVKIKYRDDGGTEADVATVTVASTVYDEFVAVMDQNPAVPADWDVTDINGGQFGVEVA